MPGAGDYRRRITLQQVTETRDSFGEPDEAWGTYAERYAALLPETGREFIGARQVVPELTAAIKLRYVAGVTPKMRVLYGTRVFDILAVIDVEERNVDLILACRELVVT